jgi:2,3-bisphosphoglycerate-independent phosphoglycerate mutase
MIPLEFQVGRGVIEALGLGMELKPGDVCARANFATLDAKGIVTDRRAGRIPTETCEKLWPCSPPRSRKSATPRSSSSRQGTPLRVVIFRGKGLEGPLTDADPNREGFAIPTCNRATRKMPSRRKWPN